MSYYANLFIVARLLLRYAMNQLDSERRMLYVPQVDSTLLGYLAEVFIYQQIQSKPMNNPGKFSFFGSFEHFVSIFCTWTHISHC